MAGNRIGGVVYITVDGNQYDARGSFEVMASTVKREGIAGQSGPQGYTEMPVMPSIKGDLTTNSTLSIAALEAITDATVQITLANGRTYILSNAWTASAFTISAAEGKVGVEFSGMSITEV